MNTCRVHMANTPDKRRMFKYAARHWAHYRCWLWAKVPEVGRPPKASDVVRLLSSLHVHQLHELPVLDLQEILHSYGIIDSPIVVLRAAIKLAEEREASPVIAPK